MDYSFDEDQEMLWRAVRDFMDRECPRPLVRDIEERRLDYSPELYQKLAEWGWCGLMIPEEYGGSNYGWVEMAVFYEEAGRAICPSPHYQTCLLAGQTLLALGSAAPRPPRADYLRVATRTAAASDDASGVTNFIIEKTTPGVSIDTMDAIGGER